MAAFCITRTETVHAYVRSCAAACVLQCAKSCGVLTCSALKIVSRKKCCSFSLARFTISCEPQHESVLPYLS